LVKIARVSAADVDALVERVATTQRWVAASCPLIDARLDERWLRERLVDDSSTTLVATRRHRILGHLTFDSGPTDHSAHEINVAPGALSFDNRTVLRALSRTVSDAAPARSIAVLAPIRDADDLMACGFVMEYRRGARALRGLGGPTLGSDLRVRRGDVHDLDAAMALAELDGPARREEWMDTLGDPECAYWILEGDSGPLAQCVTFPAPGFLGVPEATIHLSSLVVAAPSRRRGLGRALVESALGDAARAGYQFASANWREDSPAAAGFWSRLGLLPTHVRAVRRATS
jgi:ribosomal protein S18 acetylase RimI-like enzyme